MNYKLDKTMDENGKGAFLIEIELKVILAKM
jgi:hypothetical protein